MVVSNGSFKFRIRCDEEYVDHVLDDDGEVRDIVQVIDVAKTFPGCIKFFCGSEEFDLETVEAMVLNREGYHGAW